MFVRWCRAFAFILCVTQSLWSQQTANRLHESEKLLAEIEELIQAIEAGGDNESAEDFRSRLAEVRDSIEKIENVGSGDEAELHAVTLLEGTNAPAGLLDGRDRFALGYAKVNVTFNKHPIVLLLSSNQPLLWDVELAKGVRIKAAAVWNRGQDKSRVAGLPKGTLISRELPKNKWQVYTKNRQASTYLDFDGMAEYAAGMSIKTFCSARTYDKPIVVGPESRQWRLEYARGAIVELRGRVLAKQQSQVLHRFADLRFKATHSSANTGRFARPGDAAISTAEFSLLGPIKNTIQANPHSVRQLLRIEREGVEFALNRGQLVMIEQKRRPTPVPVGRQVKDRRFTGLCYDKSRHRLLVAGTSVPFASRLYEFNFAKNSWTRLADIDGTLFGIEYDADSDQMLGVVQKKAPPSEEPNPVGGMFQTGGVSMSEDDYPRMPVELVRLTADNQIKTIGPLKLPYVIRQDTVLMGGNYQLEIADLDHVVLMSPSIRLVRNQNKSFLTLIRTSDGTAIYTGEVRPHDGTKAILPASKTPPPVGGGELAAFWKQQNKVRDAIKQVGESDQKRVASLQRRFEEVDALLTGEGPKSDQPQLHWIGLYEGPQATVRVTETRHPVVLALTSNENVSWTVEKAEGVKIDRIVVVGSENPELAKSPAGVPSKIYSRRNGDDVYISVHEKQGSRYGNGAAKLKELTGLDVSSFQGNYAGGAFEVGPTNSAVLMQQVMATLKRLEKDALAGALTRHVAKLAEFSFTAMYNAPNEPPKPPAGRRRMRFERKRYLAKMTLKGPIRGTYQEINVRRGDVIEDPTQPGVAYNLEHKVNRIERDGSLTELPIDPKLPRLSWGDSITVDSKRKRLLLTSHGGSGHLYAYDLTNEKWSVLRTPGLRASAITYVAEEDALYGVSIPGGEPIVDKLRKYSPTGELIREIDIVPPIDAGGHHFNGELRVADGHAFVFGSRLPDSADPENGPTDHLQIPWVYVVDFASGEVIYDGKLEPHVGAKKLAQGQMESLWAQATANNQDNIAWKLAAGGNPVVEFLSTKLPKLETQVDSRQLDKLVSQFEAPGFRERAAAYEELGKIGRKAQAYVEAKLAAGKLPPESKSRLTRLLENWEREVPLTKNEVLELMAITTLQRIGSRDAIRVLQNLSEGPEWALRTKRSRQALIAIREKQQ